MSERKDYTLCLICGAKIRDNNLGGLKYGTESCYSPYKALCGKCYNKGMKEQADKRAEMIDYELTNKINRWKK